MTWCCNRIPRVFFNIFTPSVTRRFGYQIEELLGKSAFDFLHPDERSVAINAFPDTLKKGQGVVEAPLLHKDGHYIRMDIIAKTFYTEKGEAQGIVMGWFAVLTVTDTEGGISPKDIGRIFEPFYTKRLWAKAGQASVWRLLGNRQGP